MHDMAVTLNFHEFRHFHRVMFTNAPDIIAPEVHQHDMLGPLLWVGQQGFGNLLVLFFVFSSPAGSR